MKASGQGIGVLEAPRGILMHSYLVNQGKIERMRLMVATQFNNAYINLLLRDLAEKHLIGDSISPEGEKLIGRCVRIFDPCLSCATH
jgi:coenzyme F420-reducing hydrogenase alpha subunit